jgi:ubiquinone/menaquinone biosynthesis C-methylase UbiE
MKEILERYVKPDHKVLMAGCGNSRLSEQMYNKNIRNISNVDFSEVVINAMKEEYSTNMPEMQWQKMDLRDLEFEEGTFDVVVDKATLDSILCGDGSSSSCDRYMTEVSRVLKPGGVFIVVTYGPPEYRLGYLDRLEYEWTILSPELRLQKPDPLGGFDDKEPDPEVLPDVHYVYIMTKNK